MYVQSTQMNGIINNDRKEAFVLKPNKCSLQKCNNMILLFFDLPFVSLL